MDYLKIVLQILTFLGVIAWLLVVKKYLPSYFSKKGENLATKEDIEEITQKIESVRKIYAKDLEQIKTSLQIAASQHTTFIEEQKKVLFDFYSHCVELLVDKLSVNPGDLPIDSGKSLMEHQQAIEELVTKVLLDYYRLLLYFEHDSEMTLIAAEVVKHVFEGRKVFKKYFGRVKTALIEESEHVGTPESVYSNFVDKTNKAAKEFAEAFDPHRKGMEHEFYRYLQALNQYLKKQGAAFVINHIMNKSTEEA